MARKVADIVVSVGADAGDLIANMQRAGHAVDRFDKSANTMSVNWARVGRNVAAAAAAMGAATVAMGAQAVRAAGELERLAQVANTSVEDFQKMSIAADTVRVSQEKLADILKDVQDRVGDFLATGGGPMADFFENIAPKVGVTAEQFARLSGRDALLLFVDSLEKANLSQAEMTFYLEAMASDLTRLQPILANGGAELRRIGDEAERAGRVMSQDAVQAASDLDRKFRDVGQTIRQQFMVALVDNSEALEDLAAVFTDVVVPAAAGLVTVIGDIVSGLGNIVAGAGSAGQALRDMFADLSDAELRYQRNSIRGSNAFFENPFPQPGEGYANAAGDPATSSVPEVIDTSDLLTVAYPILPTSPSSGDGGSGGGGGGGGGGGSGMVYDFDALRDEFATAEEMIAEEYARNLAALEEYRNSKLATEEEYNELERRIHAEHEAALTQLRRDEQQSRLDAIGGALDDAATLMQSENDRLFQIGKAAATARAVIDGYEAATAAWRHGMRIGGPPLAAAFTAASLARTGALIASIQSQGSSGGSQSAGGAGAAAATATAEAPAPLQVSLSGITADELISGANVSALLERLSEEAGDRGFTVVGSAA